MGAPIVCPLGGWDCLVGGAFDTGVVVVWLVQVFVSFAFEGVGVFFAGVLADGFAGELVGDVGEPAGEGVCLAGGGGEGSGF